MCKGFLSAGVSSMLVGTGGGNAGIARADWGPAQAAVRRGEVSAGMPRVGTWARATPPLIWGLVVQPHHREARCGL